MKTSATTIDGLKKEILAFLNGKINDAEFSDIEREPIYFFPCHLQAFVLWMSN